MVMKVEVGLAELEPALDEAPEVLGVESTGVRFFLRTGGPIFISPLVRTLVEAYAEHKRVNSQVTLETFPPWIYQRSSFHVSCFC